MGVQCNLCWRDVSAALTHKWWKDEGLKQALETGLCLLENSQFYSVFTVSYVTRLTQLILEAAKSV